MSADPRPAANPTTLGRLDALPGSLTKVTLCAVCTLGIAAFVSVRKWLAMRSAEHKCESTSSSLKYGFRGKTKASNSGSSGGGNPNVAPSSNPALAGGKGEGGATPNDGAAVPPSQRPQLPPRNYFTIRASLHVKRHNAKMMEWFDEQLGIQLPFSQQLFELKQEERQAPLILLTFRTLREATHRMAVTVEELYEAQTAASYCDASLSRIAGCARVLSTSMTRIGSKEYPAAEYCYIDETQTMVFLFSIFVVHERLAVTLQYVAPTRVRNAVPTAFYDLVRYLTFTAPSPSPSYLLVSEPRLGLGYHLPLDFLVHEGLAESDGVEDRLFTSTAGGNLGGGPVTTRDRNSCSDSGGGGGLSPFQYTRGAGNAYVPKNNTQAYNNNRLRSGWSGSVVYGEGGDRMIPYATAMSRGGRRMGLIASYEPSIGISSNSGSGGGGLMDAAAAGLPGSGATHSGGGVPYAWRPYLEQQVCRAVRQLGLVLGSGQDGYNSGPCVIFQAPDPSDPSTYVNSAETLLIEPYPLSILLNGNFSSGDDIREDDGDALHVTAFSLFREVHIDVHSSCVTLVPDALDAASEQTSKHSTNNDSGGAPATVEAYWSAFYVPMGTACVSFHCIASALRHTSTEFVSFCASVMNSLSLGNHYGQAVSVLYCGTRHDVLPFRFSLPPTGMAIVEEPMLADPLCVVQATYGVEKIAVTVRVFPLFTARMTIAECNTTVNNISSGGNMNSGGGTGGQEGSTATATVATATGGRSGTSIAAAEIKAAATCAVGSVGDAHSSSSPKPTAASPAPMLLLRPGERRGTRQRSAMRQLQYMIRYYLTQFPGGVHIVSYTKTTVNSMPALLVCFRPMWKVGAEENNGSLDKNNSGGGGVASSSGSMGAVNNWDDFVGDVGGGASSQGASSWAETREAILEDEVGQLNPFAQYFAPPPPPASYLWGPQKQTNNNNNNKPSSSAQTQAFTTSSSSAAMWKTANNNGELFYPHDGGDSQLSQDDLDNPLRVTVAVCCEGNAFLFQTSASEYTLGIAQEAVRATAADLALIPRTS